MSDEEIKDEKTTKEEVRELNRKFDTLINSGAVKGIKPKKLGRSARKKGYVNYIYVRENGEIDTFKKPIEEGTSIIDEIPRLATPEHVLNWKGHPTIIQPSWSSKPFSPVENMEKTAKENMLAMGWRLLANRAELGNVKPKKKMSGTMIFFIIIALLVVGYLVLF